MGLGMIDGVSRFVLRRGHPPIYLSFPLGDGGLPLLSPSDSFLRCWSVTRRWYGALECRLALVLPPTERDSRNSYYIDREESCLSIFPPPSLSLLASFI